jgi:type I restriction enzyme S subunit
MIASFYQLSQGLVSDTWNLKYSSFSTIRINLPGRREQERIAAILDAINAQIDSSENLIDKLTTINGALAREMLGRQDCAFYPMRALCSEITVGIVVRPSQYYKPSGVPMLRSMNVKVDGIELAEVRYMSETDHRRMGKTAVRPGDIVTVRTGAPGVSAVIPESLPEANCIDIIISRPNSSVIPEYLCAWINSEFGRGQVLRGQGGLAQQHFNIHEMNTLQVAVPSIERQRSIMGVLSASRLRIQAEQRELAKLQVLKMSLSHDLLAGRVRVADRKTEHAGTG